jgi:hypothetical protein
MAVTRSIDRKLEALRKRIDAERKAAPMTKPPTEGLTSTSSTKELNVPRAPVKS